ncbi:hypothetical protein GCM10007094_22020 [Pseudovibrio japonicus]|uniref:Uncharacterized protein n=1 Tax=Pseudovibrio japonicus TaxID=366534 RepID=A0ABQ3EHP6_9HYPH|nr:hypothetical protein GCM10007094_22020 [Pseudovibrio japonicus]
MRFMRRNRIKVPIYGLINMGNILTGELTLKYRGSEIGGVQIGQQLIADLIRGTK